MAVLDLSRIKRQLISHYCNEFAKVKLNKISGQWTGKNY